VAGNGVYHPSAGFRPSEPGTYYWYASYSGDGSDASSNSGCGAGMPATAVPVRGLKLAATPSHATAGTRTCFAFRTTSSGHSVAGVTIRLAGHAVRSSHAGRATLCLALARGTHRARATRRNYRTAHATIRVTSRPSFTG
jgi:hypothetical protein